MVPPKDTSHAEIWDDSVLVESWNEALEEYKKYHGIHARGEKVGDILKEISKDSNEASDEMDYDEGEVDVDVEQGINDPQAKIAHESADPVQTTSRNTEQPFLAQNSPDKLSEKNQASAGPSPSIGSPSEGPAVPQHLIGQVQDEALKNLLMSWYYAGYYTGLYEGQQGQKPKPA